LQDQTECTEPDRISWFCSWYPPDFWFAPGYAVAAIAIGFARFLNLKWLVFTKVLDACLAQHAVALATGSLLMCENLEDVPLVDVSDDDCASRHLCGLVMHYFVLRAASAAWLLCYCRVSASPPGRLPGGGPICCRHANRRNGRGLVHLAGIRAAAGFVLVIVVVIVVVIMFIGDSYCCL
jgi:hypothetical protein